MPSVTASSAGSSNLNEETAFHLRHDAAEVPEPPPPVNDRQQDRLRRRGNAPLIFPSSSSLSSPESEADFPLLLASAASLSAVVALYELFNATAAAARYPLLLGGVLAAASDFESTAVLLMGQRGWPSGDAEAAAAAAPAVAGHRSVVEAAVKGAIGWTLFAAVAYGATAWAAVLLLQRKVSAGPVLQRFQIDVADLGAPRAAPFRAFQGAGYTTGRSGRVSGRGNTLISDAGSGAADIEA